MIDRGIFDLTGRVALVTGGSRGLGRAMAEGLAAFGADIAIAARDQGKIDETLGILAKYKVRTLGISADMTSEADIKRMVDDTVKKFGRIDILFNNAGIARPQRPIHEEVVADFDIIINTNLRGPFLVLKYVLPIMMKQKKGAIINTSSTAGLRAEIPEIAPVAYCAAKAGINLMTQVAAIEYAQYNIRVNCIAPGMHHSEIGHDIPRPSTPPDPQQIAAMQARMKKASEDIPMNRMAEANEMAGLAVLLASDASSYITGQIIVQDGGRSAKH
ncbi:MAG TPA: SDR family NAD(P)-dependent oxidoreductase [Dehalococcoidales bacterium]|nr:SDR family NAD(P)-dependent oxidoreductase [Dehalococcoidales bacterium]